MADSNDIPKGLKVLGVVWPLALAACGVAVAGVRADARIDEVAKQSQYIYDNGPPTVVARLARIEERQLILIETANRLESKLDDIDRRSGGMRNGR